MEKPEEDKQVKPKTAADIVAEALLRKIDQVDKLESENKLLREENTKCKDLAWEAANEISRLNKEIDRLKVEVLKEKFPPN